jgi:hypothetical protein
MLEITIPYNNYINNLGYSFFAGFIVSAIYILVIIYGTQYYRRIRLKRFFNEYSNKDNKKNILFNIDKLKCDIKDLVDDTNSRIFKSMYNELIEIEKIFKKLVM